MLSGGDESLAVLLDPVGMGEEKRSEEEEESVSSLSFTDPSLLSSESLPCSEAEMAVQNTHLHVITEGRFLKRPFLSQ